MVARGRFELNNADIFGVDWNSDGNVEGSGSVCNELLHEKEARINFLAGPPGVGPGTLAPLSFLFSVRVASEFVKSPVLYLFRIPTVWNPTELRARGTDNLPSCS